MTTLGVISDTHGLLREEALSALAGSDVIVHAGDIGDPGILDRLREIAPVTAVRGNNDRAAWAEGIAERETLKAGGRLFHVLHSVRDLNVDAIAARFDAVISGHSHRPQIDYRSGVLYLNPGSAGPRRFRLPVSVACIHIEGSTLMPRIIELPR